MQGYIYLLNYSELNLNKQIKIGSTKFPHSRLGTYQTGMFYYLTYKYLYKIISSKLDCYQIDDLIQETFYLDNWKVKTGQGGNEWYDYKKINNRVIEDFFDKNNIAYELVKLEDCPKDENITEFLKEYNNKFLKPFKKFKLNNIRDYQLSIIEYLNKKLIEDNKIYLELATGAGKTFITFELLYRLNPDIIICFSPRTKINLQNISDKYLKKLDYQYYPINFSENKNINEKNPKLIISCCTQSSDNLYNVIRDINFKNIFVWFDEAHWGIEETWLDSEKESTEFWLHNKSKINYRLFTSASPDNNIVTTNNKIFGELYNPIKIKDLITQKWLCPIQPYIFETPEKNNVNLSNYIIGNFIKLNKNNGLSFHSKTSNAFKLYKLHYSKYIKKETNIKPFLIIGNNNSKVNEKLLEIQNNFTNLDEYMKTKNSIAYSVKKLDMGWDFKELDFICFSDAKLSSKDIIQCIGRGTRPDRLGDDGKNLNKTLSILLPVFISDITEKNDFTQIINVLKYLILDIGLDIKKAIINKNTRKDYDKDDKDNVGYQGSDEIGAKLLKLLGYKNSLKDLYGIMRKNKIYQDDDYDRFIRNNQHLKLKKQVYDYEGFKWKQVVDINGNKYYNTYQECINAKGVLSKNKTLKNKIKRLNWSKLNKYDSKIPPYEKLKEYFY